MGDINKQNIVKREIKNLKNIYKSEETSRFKEIIFVLTKYNVIINLARQTNPQRVREAFEVLGGTFIKIGQLLSVREDIISQNFAMELKKLQDNVKIDEFSVIKPMIEENTGMPVNELFEKLNEVPIASASIAEVFLGTLKGGENVVIKVQHPNIYEKMTMDISLLEKAIPLIKHIPNTDMINLSDIVEELKRSLLLELDFTNEANNIEMFYKYNNGEHITSPKVYKQYSTKKLLIMDYMEGMKISDYIIKANEEIVKGNNIYVENKKRLADILVSNYMKQVFEDGFFHADPHPGNILVHRSKLNDEHNSESLNEASSSFSTFFKSEDLFNNKNVNQSKFESEKIVYLDFGMMGRIDSGTDEKLTKIIVAFSQKSTDEIVKAVTNLCKSSGPIDMDILKDDVDKLFSRYYDMPIEEMNIPAIFGEITKVCAKNHLILPSNITLLFKGIGTIEGIILQLDPSFSLMAAIEPYASKYILKQLDLKKEVTNFLKNIMYFAKTSPEFPLKFGKFLDDVTTGKFKINMEDKTFNKSFKKLELIINNLVMAIIVASLIIGASMLISRSTENSRYPLFAIGISLFVVAIILTGIILHNNYRKK